MTTPDEPGHQRSRLRRAKPGAETSLTAPHFTRVPLARLKPAKLNDKVYRVVDPDDPATVRLAASLKFDFGVKHLTAARVTITEEQIRDLNLPPVLKAKETSSRAAGFMAAHGQHVWELEAVEPSVLECIIGRAIESVLDLDLLRAERRQEAEDARQLEARRKVLLGALGEGGAA